MIGFCLIYHTNTMKALAYYTQNCKKCSYLPYTQQIFSQLQQFFRQFHICVTTFTTSLLEKIFKVLCVVCEGLNALLLSFSLRPKVSFFTFAQEWKMQVYTRWYIRASWKVMLTSGRTCIRVLYYLEAVLCILVRFFTQHQSSIKMCSLRQNYY